MTSGEMRTAVCTTEQPCEGIQYPTPLDDLKDVFQLTGKRDTMLKIGRPVMLDRELLYSDAPAQPTGDPPITTQEPARSNDPVPDVHPSDDPSDVLDDVKTWAKTNVDPGLVILGGLLILVALAFKWR